MGQEDRTRPSWPPSQAGKDAIPRTPLTRQLKSMDGSMGLMEQVCKQAAPGPISQTLCHGTAPRDQVSDHAGGRRGAGRAFMVCRPLRENADALSVFTSGLKMSTRWDLALEGCLLTTGGMDCVPLPCSGQQLLTDLCLASTGQSLHRDTMGATRSITSISSTPSSRAVSS